MCFFQEKSIVYSSRYRLKQVFPTFCTELTLNNVAHNPSNSILRHVDGSSAGWFSSRSYTSRLNKTINSNNQSQSISEICYGNFNMIYKVWTIFLPAGFFQWFTMRTESERVDSTLEPRDSSFSSPSRRLIQIALGQESRNIFSQIKISRNLITSCIFWKALA